MHATLPATWRLGYRPALDGLRGIAVLLVIAVHYGVPFMQGASSTGVLTFFVLSGFLITALLLEERETTGRIRLVAFYLRRARRLLPALAMMLSFVAIAAAARGTFGELWPSLAAAALYVGDIVWPLVPVQHTWTLGVEEQFYALWPLLLILGFRWPFAVAAVGLVLIPFGGALCGFGAISAGCLIAWAAHGGRLPRIPAVAGWLGLAGLLGLSTIDAGHHGSPLLLAGIVLSAGTMVAAIASEPWRSPLAWRPLRDVGRISYGIYLWHAPIIWVVGLPVLALIVTFGIAIASWRLIEAPILGRRPRASFGRKAVIAGATPSSTRA